LVIVVLVLLWIVVLGPSLIRRRHEARSQTAVGRDRNQEENLGADFPVIAKAYARIASAYDRLAILMPRSRPTRSRWWSTMTHALQ